MKKRGRARLPGPRTGRPLRPALELGTVPARSQNDPGPGSTAVQDSGYGRKGTSGLPGGPQPGPLPDRGGGQPPLRRFAASQFQRKPRRLASIQRCHRPSTESKDAPPAMGRSAAQPGPGLGSPPTQPPRAPSGQAQTQTPPIAQPTTPSLRGNLPSQPDR